MRYGGLKATELNRRTRPLACLSNYVFPAIGNHPITELKTRHFTALLKGTEKNGLLEIASRARQHLCNIMRYAVQQGWVGNNPELDLVSVTASSVKRYYLNLTLAASA
ncbi:phage integrase central domain-containing protein [Lonsdalea britannica]|uniref:phage integrase central domain-containing protein n=1 Tax=Lonsdalea britannica TaxID=1082704 RepID=UPI003B84644F